MNIKSYITEHKYHLGNKNMELLDQYNKSNEDFKQ